MHIGTFNGWRRFILENEMDSIKQANADLIVFTGDLQNMRPSEILPFTNLLKTSMKNAIAVRGNHDYTEYVKLNPKDAEQQNKDFADIVRSKLGWKLLENSHVTIRRGTDSIVVAGTSARPIGMETPHSAWKDGADNAERAHPRWTNADFWLPSDQNSGEKRLWRVSQRQPDT